MKLPSTRMILFNVAGSVIGVSVLIGLIRPLLITPTIPPCSQRYQHSMTFQLARAGVLLSAADLQSSLGGKDLGVIENLSIAAEKDAPAPVSMRVRLPKGAASPFSSAERKGGMSFPWEPRSLQRASAACVSYDVLLPADFDLMRGGRLPGLIGSDGVGQESFAARILWRPGGGGAAAVRTLSAGDVRQSTLGLDEFAFPRGRWFKIEQEVVLNTPKQANGRLTVWVDGTRVGERSDLVFRSDASVVVSGVSAEVFYGGEDAAATVPKDATVRLSPFELRWR
jgi:polysaccharide lyase-like protein